MSSTDVTGVAVVATDTARLLLSQVLTALDSVHTHIAASVVSAIVIGVCAVLLALLTFIFPVEL